MLQGSSSSARRTWLAVGSLVLLLLAPLSWLWAIDVPRLRSTGLTAWLLLAAALLLSASAARIDRRRWVRGVLGVQVAALALFAWLFFDYARLPAARAGELASAPDFTLPDHLGRPVHLADELAKGPVLLVFFRGPW